MADDAELLSSTPGRVVPSGAKVTPGGDQGVPGAAGPPGGLGEAPIDGQTYGRKSAAWAVIAGGGNVSNTGTPAAGQVALWTNATTIQGRADWPGGWLSGNAAIGGSAAGQLTVTYAAPFINMQPGGTDADIYVQMSSKGIAHIAFYTGAFARSQVVIEDFASGGKYIGLRGGAGITNNIHLSDNSAIGILNANLAGAPIAVTPATGDDSVAVATTAFVKAQGYITSSALVTYAPINSPTFTGDPKSVTPPAGDNDTSIATTAFVQGAKSRVLIQNLDPANVPSVTFGPLPAGYDVFEIEWLVLLAPGSAATPLMLVVSADGGATWPTGYASVGTYAASDGSGGPSGTSNGAGYTLANAITDGIWTAGTAKLFKPTGNGVHHNITSQASGHNGAVFYSWVGAAMCPVVTPITHLRVYTYNGANFANIPGAGFVKLYGVR